MQAPGRFSGGRLQTLRRPVGLAGGSEECRFISYFRLHLGFAGRRAKGDSLPGLMERVSAHITGTVWKIQVKVGDEVAAGTVLVILESMKMEMPVEAEAAGKVTEIHVTEGQAVDEGDPLVTIG